MKNQYFGDTRDLFKYDLALRVMEGIPALSSFTFLAMLTPDDGSGQGSQVRQGRGSAGSHNQALAGQLAGCVREGRRDIREILPFLGDRGIRVHLCRDPFTHGERGGYFRSIPDTWLQDALVFLDPDIGLGVARPTGKHLQLAEVRALLGRTTGSSVLMVFQYFPRVNRSLYLEKRIGELREIAPQGIAAISDSRVAFFFIGREQETMGQVREILARYRDEYPALVLSPR